jgi:hypothetical protein
MINISSAMGGQFALSAAEITDEIKQIGPNPLRGPDLMMSEGASGTDDRDEEANG